MKKNNKALKIIALSTGASIALGVCGLINSTKIDNRKKELLENGVAVTASNDTFKFCPIFVPVAQVFHTP